ncbi:MAG: DUF3137 domain-containing protein [Proteobacteria bacterium]|nr:DUF3137 domain-containing protein [Pseudomonadota bacterium]
MFKQSIVYDLLSKRCNFQVYLFETMRLMSWPNAILGYAGVRYPDQYMLNDYIKGVYHGYTFRIMDCEPRDSKNKHENYCVLAIEVGRCLTDRYLHLCPYSRLFGEYQKTDMYAHTPFFTNPEIKKSIMVGLDGSAYHPTRIHAVIKTYELWEAGRLIPEAMNLQTIASKGTYQVEDVLTELLAERIETVRKVHPDLHIHFEGDQMLIRYPYRGDYFEPVIKYGIISREGVERDINIDIAKVFSVFDSMIPFLEVVFPVSTEDMLDGSDEHTAMGHFEP